MLEASLYVSQNLPEGGLWAVVHCATWVALGELEWIPFAVLRKSIDVNLLGKFFLNPSNDVQCDFQRLQRNIEMRTYSL